VSCTKRALISVSCKDGVVELARSLTSHGYAILSTGGTAVLLRENAISITEVADYTGFPEMMGGRVKTLHPKIHGGILGRRDQDAEVMQAHDIDPIDIVVVNLYPFEATTAKSACTLQDAIENIDIGGPAMVRSAAKNYASVSVITDPGDYPRIEQAAASADGVPLELRYELAVKAFEHTARYDGLIASYLGRHLSTQDPPAILSEKTEYARTINFQYQKKLDLRYGENPHQSAAFYTHTATQGPATGTVSSATQIQGKELSYNNIADTDAALECVQQFTQPACVIVKHANPCGVAESADLVQAYEAAWQTDPTSAFGGIIAFNGELDTALAELIVAKQFVEVIIAPSVSAGASAVVAQKPNIRLLESGPFVASTGAHHLTHVAGGVLVQQKDAELLYPGDLKVVTQVKPTETEMQDAVFAWKVAKYVKSNAIVYCRERRTIGVGAGQMSRVYSAKVAALKAADEKLPVAGAVMASDAFFPFRDGIDAAAQAGIKVVIQPGGSKNDPEVIAAADEHGLAMVFTGMRHFRH